MGTSDEAAQVLEMTPLDTELALACLASNCAYTAVVATEGHGKAFIGRIQQQVFDNFFNESMTDFYDAHAVAALAVATAEAKKRVGGPDDDLDPKPKPNKAAKTAAAKATPAAKKVPKDDVGKQLQDMLRQSKAANTDEVETEPEETDEEPQGVGASA